MTALPSGQQPCTLMVCTDGSPASQGAVEAGLVLARRWSGRILLLQVLEYNPGYASQAMDGIEAWEREAREGLNAMRDRAAASGVEAEVLVRRGEAAPRTILSEAEQHRPRLIIMGRRGRSDLAEVLMGDVTARVTAHSPVSVLIVPRDAPLSFQRLLVASDGSPCCAPAWQEALALAKAWFCHLLAVHVAEKTAALPGPTPQSSRGCGVRRIRPASPWTPWYCKVYPTGPSCRLPRPEAPISSSWGATSAPGSPLHRQRRPRRSSARPAVQSWW